VQARLLQRDAVKLAGQSLSNGPIAVIDIGSNSVRLVAYDALTRAPIQTFNEKSLCGLGRDVAITGLLPEDGLVQARAAIRRFRVLCDVMKVDRLFVLATAAARRATNGPAFIEEVRRELKTDVTILSGAEEARLAAMGVLAGLDAPDGFAGDLGGGSLELIDIRNGSIGQGVSLELGGFALRDASGRNLKRASKIVSDAFGTLPQLRAVAGRDILAIGGTWRAIARLHMAVTNYPLNVLHGYTVDAPVMVEFCRLIQRVPPETLPSIAEIARERRALLAYGAIVLEHLLLSSEARSFIVCASGVREGVLYSSLTAEEQAQDPLIVASRALSDLHARAPGHAEELLAWMKAFVESAHLPEIRQEKRLREAACLLSEVAWRASPDYRAQEASRIVAFAALPAINHVDRAFLASVMHARYEGLKETNLPPLRSLLTPEKIDKARALGCLIRVAYNISAGQPGILPQTPLVVEEGRMVLTLGYDFANLSNERLLGRLKQAAKMLNMRVDVRVI
jgi:exopolyphosphatase / guanosine-5'-triphosphate,3'-diphosphate pyrophosphatase